MAPLLLSLEESGKRREKHQTGQARGTEPHAQPAAPAPSCLLVDLAALTRDASAHPRAGITIYDKWHLGRGLLMETEGRPSRSVSDEEAKAPGRQEVCLGHIARKEWQSRGWHPGLGTPCAVLVACFSCLSATWATAWCGHRGGLLKFWLQESVTEKM